MLVAGAWFCRFLDDSSTHLGRPEEAAGAGSGGHSGVMGPIRSRRTDRGTHAIFSVVSYLHATFVRWIWIRGFVC